MVPSHFSYWVRPPIFINATVRYVERLWVRRAFLLALVVAEIFNGNLERITYKPSKHRLDIIQRFARSAAAMCPFRMMTKLPIGCPQG